MRADVQFWKGCMSSRGTLVCWANSNVGGVHPRSLAFVERLNLRLLFVQNSRLDSKFLLPLRYLLFFVQTLNRLRIVRPTYVIVVTPPIFPLMAVSLYSLFTRTKFAVDAHSGTFESWKWKWALGIFRWMGLRASFILVTNAAHFELAKKWKMRPLIVGDPPPDIPASEPGAAPVSLPASPSVAVVNTYAKNEALGEILEAARLAGGVTFYITGDKRKASRELVESLTENVVLTGWLSDTEYWRLLSTCNLVITLIEQENTILQGGWEAMFVGQPLVTTDTASLREYFCKGTVFVENRAMSIAAGIQRGLENEQKLRQGMEVLRLQRTREWEQQKRTLLMELAGA